MKANYIPALAMIAALLATPVHAEMIGDWDTDFSHGFATYQLTKGGSNLFRFRCADDVSGYGAYLEFEITGKRPAPFSTVTATTREGDFQLLIDEGGLGATDSHVGSDNFHALVDSLQRSNRLTITYENGATVTFKARGGRRALDGADCATDFELN